MKRFGAAITLLLILSSFGFSADKARSFKGEIMDSACAKMGSHDMMMKKEGAKNAKECTLGCVKMGSKYVLFDSASKKVYELDDQTKPEQFAGDKVTVKGTLDKKTNTIHVTDIQAGS
jgi:type 1 fimbria pilin